MQMYECLGYISVKGLLTIALIDIDISVKKVQKKSTPAHAQKQLINDYIWSMMYEYLMKRTP